MREILQAVRETIRDAKTRLTLLGIETLVFPYGGPHKTKWCDTSIRSKKRGTCIDYQAGSGMRIESEMDAGRAWMGGNRVSKRPLEKACAHSSTRLFYLKKRLIFQFLDDT